MVSVVVVLEIIVVDVAARLAVELEALPVVAVLEFSVVDVVARL